MWFHDVYECVCVYSYDYMCRIFCNIFFNLVSKTVHFVSADIIVKAQRLFYMASVIVNLFSMQLTFLNFEQISVVCQFVLKMLREFLLYVNLL